MPQLVNQSPRLSRSQVARSENSRTFVSSFATELGWMAVAWNDEAIIGNAFGYDSGRSAELAIAGMPSLSPSFLRVTPSGQAGALPPWVAKTVAQLEQFASGEPVSFSDVPLAIDHLTSFGRHVIAACRRIPWGQTRSYGDLAAECGSPGAARAVGSVMAKNRYPLIVPCHRVLAAGGELGGYSAPEGLKMKRRLLNMEGTSPKRPK